MPTNFPLGHREAVFGIFTLINTCLLPLLGERLFILFLAFLSDPRESGPFLIPGRFDVHCDILRLISCNINLTKDSSLLLHAIHSPFYWRILKKTIPVPTLLWF